MSVKITLSAEQLNFNSFDEFKTFLEASCNNTVKKIQFQDDEGDLVSVTSDLELKEAIRVSKSVGELHLHVTLEESNPPIVNQPSVQSAERNENTKRNHNAICDSCNEQITSVRYKCSNCPDYDLCEGCEASHQSQPKHNPEHVFLKIYKPIRHGFRNILPSLYSVQTERKCPYLANLKAKEAEGDHPHNIKAERVEGPKCPRNHWHHHHSQDPLQVSYATRLSSVEKQLEEIKKLLPQENKSEQIRENRRSLIQERMERKKKCIQDKKCLKVKKDLPVAGDEKLAKSETSQPEVAVEKSEEKLIPNQMKQTDLPIQQEVKQTEQPESFNKPAQTQIELEKSEVKETKEENLNPQTIELLALLNSMGFVEQKLNIELLTKHQNELSLVIEELLVSH